MPPPRARPGRLGAETALAFGVGAASFTVVGAILAAAHSDIVAILLGPICVVAVIRIMHSCGVAYGVPAAMAGMLAYDWFEIPPTHPLALPDAANLGNLLVYLAVAAVIGRLATDASRRAVISEQARSELAAEQAALRRVATLVAKRAEPHAVCAAVAREVGQLLGVDAAYMGRYEDDGDTVTGVASWSRTGDHLPVGTRSSVEGDSVTARVRRTSRPARMHSYDAAAGSIAELLRNAGMRSSAGAPIIVDGRLWGVMIASMREERPLPDETEARIAGFTELAATAISDSEAWVEVRRLADEQTALRRVATLVAHASPPPRVFAAVAEEVARLFGVDGARMWRYESDEQATVLAAWGKLDISARVGTRKIPEAHSIAGQVRSTGRPARIAYDESVYPMSADARAAGIREAVGTPIVVDGRLWGAMVVATTRDEPLPADTESRVGEFTELIATAISNLQARSELAASRARIVAATDDERRRVVRDLHDGAQQRLVQTVVMLKLAQRELERLPEHAPELVSEALDHAEQAMVELRELAHGILPAALTRGGLRAGVEALASRMPLPVTNDVASDRLPRPVEATAYFVVSEALTNVVKHAHAHTAVVAASVEDDLLRVEVRDDGIGGARADGHGLLGLSDRLAAVEGTLRIESPQGEGTVVAAAMPLGDGRRP